MLDGLHRLAVNLRPASLDRLGLVPALNQYIQTFRQQSNLNVELLTAGLEANSMRLCPDIETTVYRVVQEAMTNVVRHAHATRVSVLVERHDGYVLAIIEDDGVGFDPEEAMHRSRLGLFGMQERAETYGGSFTIESSAGSGTTVFLKLPCLGGPAAIELDGSLPRRWGEGELVNARCAESQNCRSRPPGRYRQWPRLV